MLGIIDLYYYYIFIYYLLLLFYNKTYSILKLTGKYGTVATYYCSNDHDITLYSKLLIILLMVHLPSSNILVMSSELPWNGI